MPFSAGQYVTVMLEGGDSRNYSIAIPPHLNDIIEVHPNGRRVVRFRTARAADTPRFMAELIERLSPRGPKKTHPATKVFQALRIAVNDEIGALERGLSGALKILKPGGRMAVITFHSLEDRVVKDFGRRMARDYLIDGAVDVPELRRPCAPTVLLVTRKAIVPGAAELAANHRSRSAQLRIFEKI